MQVSQLEWWLSLVFPSLTWTKRTSRKEIFLTFDDGPVPEVTEFVLDQLSKYNAKATFFCVGDNVRKHPEVFRKIMEGGHSFGNHTFNHLNGWETNNENYFENITECEKILSEVASCDSQKEVKVRLFRPPYGKIKRSQIKEVNKKYEIIMWDVLTGDYDAKFPANDCLKRSIKLTKPGSIIIFHDSIKAEKNVKEVLPKYLEYFSKEGFTFSAL